MNVDHVRYIIYKKLFMITNTKVKYFFSFTSSFFSKKQTRLENT